jgi:hypothetical protein
LETLYDEVVPNGFIVFDDYGLWQGCRQAVNDFFVEHNIDGRLLRRVGSHQAYFQTMRVHTNNSTRRPA